MGRVGTEHLMVEEESTINREYRQRVSFKYSIDVSSKGIFSTMLPEHIVEAFKSANIELHKNRIDKEGYLCAMTLDELKQRVIDLCKEYLSRELVTSSIIIKYGIKTQASYCLDIEGEVVPNGRWTKYNGYEWKNGTEFQAAANPRPFGIMVYAQPFYKKIYQYRSGIKKEELVSLRENSENEKTRPNLHWLSAICSISPEGLQIQEMEYSEEVAAVFVNMIKAICAVNEHVKEFITPDQILFLAQSNQKLLG